jgi:hypothetical protein
MKDIEVFGDMRELVWIHATGTWRALDVDQSVAILLDNRSELVAESQIGVVSHSSDRVCWAIVSGCARQRRVALGFEHTVVGMIGDRGGRCVSTVSLGSFSLLTALIFHGQLNRFRDVVVICISPRLHFDQVVRFSSFRGARQLVCI